MKTKTIIKIIWILVCIIPICVFAYFETIGEAKFDTVSSNKMLIIILELINLGIALLLFKSKGKLSKKYIIILIIYLAIIVLIPCYNLTKTYAPSGPKSELMGLALERMYKNLFGINLKFIK